MEYRNISKEILKNSQIFFPKILEVTQRFSTYLDGLGKIDAELIHRDLTLEINRILLWSVRSRLANILNFSGNMINSIDSYHEAYESHVDNVSETFDNRRKYLQEICVSMFSFIVKKSVPYISNL